MNYLVLENHLSYSIVLDEHGRFIKVANMNYQVGQKVSQVYPMDVVIEAPAPTFWERLKKFFWLPTLAVSMALILIVANVFQQYTTFASVYLAINPEVRIDINQAERVIGLDGTNLDGQDLVRDYIYKKKHLDQVMTELIDRAIDMGYLSEGGKVAIDLATADAEWSSNTGAVMRQQLNNYLKDKLKITIQIDGKVTIDEDVIVPIIPPKPIPPTGPIDDSNYDDTDYGEIDDDWDDVDEIDDDIYEPIDSDYWDDDSEFDD